MIQTTVRSVCFKLMGLVMVCAGLVLIVHCGKKSSSDDSGSPSATTTITDPAQATSLALGTDGTAVNAPANSLAKGTVLTLSSTSSPSQFSDATSGNNTPASGALQLSMQDSSGNNVNASSAVTLTVPYTGSTSSLRLTSVATTVADILALFEKYDGTLYYWLSAELTIDTTNKLVKIPSVSGGIFQLTYAAQSAPTNFKSATASGVSPMTAGSINYSGISCTTSGDVNIYSQVSGLSSFQTYVNDLISCCTTKGTAAATCSTTIQTALATYMCVPQSEASVITTAAWNQSFTAAAAAYKCQ